MSCFFNLIRISILKYIYIESKSKFMERYETYIKCYIKNIDLTCDIIFLLSKSYMHTIQEKVAKVVYCWNVSLGRGIFIGA